MLALLRQKARPKTLTGISITPAGYSAARVRCRDGLIPELIQCVFRPSASEADPDKALASLAREYQLAGTPCSAVVEAQAYSLLLIEAPPVPPAELLAAARWRIKDLIDFPPDQAVIDVFDLPSQPPGRPRSVYVVAARTSLVQTYAKSFREAGLKLSIIDIPELVLRNIAALLPEDSRGLVLLHLAQQGGHIILSRQAELYLARSIETGTAQLMSHVPASQGEGFAEPSDDLKQALDNIILEIQRSLDYYESHYAQPPIAHLIITPTQPQVPGAVDYIAANIGILTRELNLNDILQCAEPLSRSLQTRCLLAIGAALRTNGAV